MLEYEGYFRAFTSIPVIIILFIFFRAKTAAVSREGLLSENKIIDNIIKLESRPSNFKSHWHRIATYQAIFREVFTKLVVLSIIISIFSWYIYFLWNTRVGDFWPEFSLVKTDSGVTAWMCILSIVLKALVALIISAIGAIIIIYILAIALSIIAPVVYLYLVFSSLLYFISIIGWILTGKYQHFDFLFFLPSMISAIFGVVGILVSDAIDIAILFVDKTLCIINK